MKLFAILAVVLVCTAAGHGADIYVPDHHPTIQDAITVAVDGDSIIVRPGIYVERINFIGKSITVKSENGPGVTIIDGNYYGSVVRFVTGEDSAAVLEGFTIRNGNSMSIHMDGGGIYCRVASPTIKNNIITGNSARDDGGGIYCASSSMTISGNTITLNNNLDGSGGGICVNLTSSPVIADNTIIGNTAKWHGGGISVLSDCSPEITGNVIVQNESERGGGIWSSGSSSMIIINNIIAGNKVSLDGGGIYHSGFSGTTIVNNILTMNAAVRDGGGIFCDARETSITNNTITRNRAGHEGGGIFCDQYHPIVRNTIVWENTAPGGPEIQHNPGADPIVSYCDVKGGWTGTGNIDADPLFVDPDKGDVHLTFNSPCRNKGDNSVVPPALLRDIEGDRRIFDSTVDMGADEFHTHLYALGSVVAGNSITIKVIGPPGAPVVLAQGSGVQDPPLQTSCGPFHLQLPMVSQTSLGVLSGDGYIGKIAKVPSAWQPGEEYPFQALVGPFVPGSEFTNLMLLAVETP